MKVFLEKRDIAVDLFKVAGLLLITVYHVWRFIGKPSTGTYIDPWNIASNGDVGVELTIFLTSYIFIKKNSCLTPLKKSYARVLKSFFLKFVPRYYVAILLWNLLLLMGVTKKSHGVWDNLTHLTFTHVFFPETFFSICGTLWYVGLYIQLILVLPLILHYYQKRGSVVTAFFLSGVGVSFLINFLKMPRVLTWSVVSYFPIVLFSFYLATYSESSIFKKHDKKILMMASLASLFLLTTKTQFFFSAESKDILIGMLLGLACVSSHRFIDEIDADIQSSIVKISNLSILLFFYNYIFYAAPRASWHGVGGLFVYTAFVYIFCFLFYQCEKQIGRYCRMRLKGNTHYGEDTFSKKYDLSA